MPEVLHPVVFRPLQARFLTIPQAPLCYWLRERFFELLAGANLGNFADVCQGLVTGNDPRFTRFIWEAGQRDWARPWRQRRWAPFEKGGGYGKWFGHQFWVVDWYHEGARIRSTPNPRVQNEHHYFDAGWTYSYMARGSVGLRLIANGTITCDLSAGVFPRNSVSLGAILNARLSSYIVRSITPKIQLRESYVSRVPVPHHFPDSLAAFEIGCVSLKRDLVALDPNERSFSGIPVAGASFSEAWRNLANRTEAVAAVLHMLEGLSERDVFAAYGIAGYDLQAVLDETGIPAAWFPLLSRYDAVPHLPPELEVSAELLAPLAHEPHRTLSGEDLATLKRRLRALYEAGPGGTVEDEEPRDEEDDEEESKAAVSGARIPIPAETFVEELSQRLEVHPISIYWLLRELRDKDGAVCGAELERFTLDYLSVLVLRILGHRWPREIEAGEPLPMWVDADGIIPLTDGTSEPTLLERMRDRLADDFGADRMGAIEREFEAITRRPVGAWLTTAFFKRHISQFRKRPVALQIVSSLRNNERGRGRSARRNTPAFSCLVYYHRLDVDLLPKLRTQYLGPLRLIFQTELGSLEKLKERSADQDARRLELEEKLEEIKSFEARLEAVITEGFASAALDKIVAREPLDKWTSRDGLAPPPETREAFLVQERRYDPDLNDGVRVNIAPLQRAGLLAADVLASKDIEKAIADRAEWRADERRWCREGKLPRPGWWKEERR